MLDQSDRKERTPAKALFLCRVNKLLRYCWNKNKTIKNTYAEKKQETILVINFATSLK
jgi:hypothetical protein